MPLCSLARTGIKTAGRGRQCTVGPAFRRQARQAFELDQRNAETMNDLFDYFLEAPRLLGGGLHRAATLANEIRALDTSEYELDHRQDSRKKLTNRDRRSALSPRLATGASGPGRLSIWRGSWLHQSDTRNPTPSSKGARSMARQINYGHSPGWGGILLAGRNLETPNRSSRAT